jgi:hypothetical protein
MPIHYQIHTDKRLVVARGSGVFTDEDVFRYQREVWSRPEVAGFDELVDMTAVESIAVPSAARVRDLAALSASMDPPSAPSRMAIVAPQDIAYGLGRMYEANREMDERSTKKVEVFRTLEEALAFLGIESLA